MNQENKREDILEITEELVFQVDRTKKLLLWLLFGIIGAVLAVWIFTSIFTSNTSGFLVSLHLGLVPGFFVFSIIFVFLGIVVRQWWILSKWSKKYAKYRQMQEEISRRLDFEKEKRL